MILFTLSTRNCSLFCTSRMYDHISMHTIETVAMFEGYVALGIRALARILKLPVIFERVPVKKEKLMVSERPKSSPARKPSHVGSKGSPLRPLVGSRGNPLAGVQGEGPLEALEFHLFLMP